MQPICRKCGNDELLRTWGRPYCPKCRQWHDESEIVPDPARMRGPLEPLYRVPRAAVVDFAGHAFIAEEALETFDDYYSHDVGDIISVAGLSGRTLFFELAGRVASGGRKGYLCVQIDPHTEFKDLPTLDVNPEEATILGKEEEDKSGDSPRES